MIIICCSLRPKSKKISELSEKRGFNRYTGVIGCADSEYINANISHDKYSLCYKVSSLNFQKKLPPYRGLKVRVLIYSKITTLARANEARSYIYVYRENVFCFNRIDVFIYLLYHSNFRNLYKKVMSEDNESFDATRQSFL